MNSCRTSAIDVLDADKYWTDVDVLLVEEQLPVLSRSGSYLSGYVYVKQR